MLSRKFKIERVTKEILDEIEAFSGEEGSIEYLKDRFLFLAREEKK